MNFQLNILFEKLSESLDITPTEYKKAVDSYMSVGKWLEDGHESGYYTHSYSKPVIYPQGSINLGTIIRPLKNGKEAEYDIDLVCELQSIKELVDPDDVKNQIGDRIKDHNVYNEKLDEEGRRCWTLNYSQSSGSGLHIDILPCIPLDSNLGINITDYSKEKEIYSWRESNPKGFAEWFKNRNTTTSYFAESQKDYLFRTAFLEDGRTRIFSSIEDIPEQLIRTPLQRAIQVMKRHRDVMFKDNPSIKPISMIITTLSAHVYNGEDTVYQSLLNIVNKIAAHAGYLENQYFKLSEDIAKLGLINRRPNGEWYIPNPTNKDENFADKWHNDNHSKAKSFFHWIKKLQLDINSLNENITSDQLELKMKQLFGEDVTTRSFSKIRQGVIEKDFRTNDVSVKKTYSLGFPHRQNPIWPIVKKASIDIICRYYFGGQWLLLQNNGTPIPKNCKIEFTARTNVAGSYEVYWQVVNTGEEAALYGGLRGRIFKSTTYGTGALKQIENSLYKGMHFIVCFIVQNGVCVAMSDEFIVNIQ